MDKKCLVMTLCLTQTGLWNMYVKNLTLANEQCKSILRALKIHDVKHVVCRILKKKHSIKRACMFAVSPRISLGLIDGDPWRKVPACSPHSALTPAQMCRGERGPGPKRETGMMEREGASAIYPGGCLRQTGHIVRVALTSPLSPDPSA